MARPSRKPRFEPDWENGYVWNDAPFPDPENRSPYTTLPTTIFDAVRQTYHSSGSLDTHLTLFDCFLKLPPELRRIIWILSLPDARVVPIFYESSTKITRSDCSIPSQLHVSREARNIALEYYELAFGTGENPPAVFFDFSRDQLYLGAGNISQEDCIKFLLELDRASVELSAQSQNIQRIAMDELLGLHIAVFDDREYRYLGGRAERLLDMPSFQGLRLITIVRDDRDWDVFLAEVDSNPGEVQSWSICPEGRALEYKPAPWPESSFWQRVFLKIWKNLETLLPRPLTEFEMASTEGISEENVPSGLSQPTNADDPVNLPDERGFTDLSETMGTLKVESMLEDGDKKRKIHNLIPTVRLVSISRLGCNDAVWQSRQNFLQGKSYVYRMQCMVPEHDAEPLRVFLDLETQFPRLYRGLEDALNRLLGGQRQGSLFDVIQVLCSRLAKTPGICVCLTKHADVHHNWILSLEEAFAPEGSHFKNVVDWVLEYVRNFKMRLSNEAFVQAVGNHLKQIQATHVQAALFGTRPCVATTEAMVYYLIGHIDLVLSQ